MKAKFDEKGKFIMEAESKEEAIMLLVAVRSDAGALLIKEVLVPNEFMPERESGYYWVRYGEELIIAEYISGGKWFFAGGECSHGDNEFGEISKNKLMPISDK